MSTQKADPVVGGGVVTGVNKPGDGSFNAFTVGNGDEITSTKYQPTKDDVDVRTVAGATYNMLMITQPKNNKAQAFIVWSPDDPKVQDRLEGANTTVQGIGTTNQAIQRGDTIEMRTGPAEGGGFGVTLDIKRGNNYVATFSFVVP
jgi:hypothetical protein